MRPGQYCVLTSIHLLRNRYNAALRCEAPQRKTPVMNKRFTDDEDTEALNELTPSADHCQHQQPRQRPEHYAGSGK
jgi:hypothetical protein